MAWLKKQNKKNTKIIKKVGVKCPSMLFGVTFSFVLETMFIVDSKKSLAVFPYCWSR